MSLTGMQSCQCCLCRYVAGLCLRRKESERRVKRLVHKVLSSSWFCDLGVPGAWNLEPGIINEGEGQQQPQVRCSARVHHPRVGCWEANLCYLKCILFYNPEDYKLPCCACVWLYNKTMQSNIFAFPYLFIFCFLFSFIYTVVLINVHILA